MSSIKIAHFVRIRYQTWAPQTIFVSDWLISKKSYPLKPLCQEQEWPVVAMFVNESEQNEHSL
jgi:hypothetical protein